MCPLARSGGAMRLIESFQVALRALMANRLRAVLTMLGVIIGVASVILLVSIGSGVRELVTKQISGLGSELLFVLPGKMDNGDPSGLGRFQVSDYELLRNRLTDVEAITPEVEGQAAVKAGRDKYVIPLYGGGGQAFKTYTSGMAAGQPYGSAEVNGSAKVVDLGWTVARSLGGLEAVGKMIRIAGERFRVIGTMSKQGGGMMGDLDRAIYLPYTSANRLLGTNDLSAITIKARRRSDMPRLKKQIAKALEPKYRERFTVMTQDQMLGMISTVLSTLTAMLAGIAAISLVVGGIGIMNIMLVSVTERTREIGIRKAVGARPRDILSQFVVEAVALSVLGGVLGILLGAGGALALRRWVPAVVSPMSVLLAFGFSAAVGIFFGVYHAWKASKLEPIAALRRG
jgi:putative ABC transport system permease protein